MPRSDLDPAAIDVERAAAGLGDRVHRTPTFSSRTLGRIAGVPVSAEGELFQRTGSFKPRGAFTRLDALTAAERRQGVVTVSAGNHAAALAFTAAEAEIDCLVLMTRGASELKAAAARDYGATLDREAEDPAALFSRLDELRGDRVLVHPFDDPLVIAGQGTVGVELLEGPPRGRAGRRPRGRRRARGRHRGRGGGDPALGAYRGRRARRVRPLSTRPLRPGDPFPLAPHSVADGLNAPFAGGLPLAVCRAFGVEHVTVSERRSGPVFGSCTARQARRRAGQRRGVAALLAGKIDVSEVSGVGVVVSRRQRGAEIASGILRFDEG